MIRTVFDGLSEKKNRWILEARALPCFMIFEVIELSMVDGFRLMWMD